MKHLMHILGAFVIHADVSMRNALRFALKLPAKKLYAGTLYLNRKLVLGFIHRTCGFKQMVILRVQIIPWSVAHHYTH
jgi:hypothetical protein